MPTITLPVLNEGKVEAKGDDLLFQEPMYGPPMGEDKNDDDIRLSVTARPILVTYRTSRVLEN